MGDSPQNGLEVPIGGAKRAEEGLVEVLLGAAECRVDPGRSAPGEKLEDPVGAGHAGGRLGGSRRRESVPILLRRGSVAAAPGTRPAQGSQLLVVPVPGPWVQVSVPSPPSRVSSPAPPMRVSLPARPLRVSLPGVPLMTL